MDNINNKLLNENEMNTLIRRYIDKTTSVFKKSKVVFNGITDIKTIQKAFMHKSFMDSYLQSFLSIENSTSCINLDIGVLCHPFGVNDTPSGYHYESLEFLGDRVIEMIIGEFVYDSYPNKGPGFLTDLKSRLVRKSCLAELFEKLGLVKYILISCHQERIGGRENRRFYEDIFESFIGCLYIDQNRNIEICKRFLIGVYLEFIDIDNVINNDINYKTLLLKYFHSMKFGHPVYNEVYRIGPTFDIEYTCVVLIPNAVMDKIKTKDLVQKRNGIIAQIENEIVSFGGGVNYLNGVPLGETCGNEKLFENLRKTIKDLMTTGFVVGIGKGPNKKASEQICSLNCLENLGVEIGALS